MSFAERTRWAREANALARAREDLPPEIDLTESNPTCVGLPYDARRILTALASPDVLKYRPEPLGPRAAREAIARYYLARGKTVDPDRIVLTASTSEAYTHAMRLLCDADDGVLVPTPSYPLFEYLLGLSDVRPIPYRLRYDDEWHLDRNLDADARAICVVSPNNPTGSVLSAEDRAWMTAEAVRREIPIISDEVFADYSARDASWIGAGPPLLALNGLSKIAGLPQLKLGWMVVDGPEAWAQEAIARLEIIADTYLSVSAPVAYALPTLLDEARHFQDALRARLAVNRAAVEALTAASAVRARRSDGGWSAMLDVPRTESDERWCLRLLREERVAVQPGWYYDLEEPGCLVVSLIVEPTRFAEGLRRMMRVIRQNS